MKNREKQRNQWSQPIRKHQQRAFCWSKLVIFTTKREKQRNPLSQPIRKPQTKKNGQKLLFL